MTYHEACELLMKHADQFQSKPAPGDDFGVEHELFIVQHAATPTFVVDWPSSIKPFYMRTNENNENLVIYLIYLNFPILS